MIDPALESAYNVRAAVADHARFFAAWAERSARVRRALSHRLDEPYGIRPEETMDLFSPRAGGPWPIHLFIHGGYWQGRDKSEFSFLAEPLAARGALVAVMNYPLCPAVGLDRIVEAARHAVAWLWRAAGRFGGDPARLHVSGHSAGGHLVAMLMATDWPAFDDRLPGDLIRSGLSISGLFDLEPLCHTSINTAVGMDAAAARRNSPLFLAPRAPGPLALAVGGLESAAFHAQSDALAERWGKAGVDVRRVALADRHHLSAVEALGEPDSPLCAEASRLLGL